MCEVIIELYHVSQSVLSIEVSCGIGGRNRVPGGPWPLLNLRAIHRNVIFTVENQFSLAKGPPYF